MRPTSSFRFRRSRERGVVLLISLIVLVAMSLAGVALMRSVDTTVAMAGNVAFKQTAIQVADNGTQQASAWISTNSTGTTLQNDNPTAGYFSAKPGTEPDWYNASSWSQAVTLNGGTPDPAGNVTRYIIHRMCTQPNTPHDATNAGVQNECARYYPLSGSTSGGSMQVGAPQFLGSPWLYYRVTTRVDGPRNTVSIIQTSVIVST